MNLGSLLIGSSAVETMKEWYRAAFDVKENEMGAFTFGSTQLFIEEHSEVSGPTKEPRGSSSTWTWRTAARSRRT